MSNSELVDLYFSISEITKQIRVFTCKGRISCHPAKQVTEATKPPRSRTMDAPNCPPSSVHGAWAFESDAAFNPDLPFTMPSNDEEWYVPPEERTEVPTAGRHKARTPKQAQDKHSGGAGTGEASSTAHAAGFEFGNFRGVSPPATQVALPMVQFMLRLAFATGMTEPGGDRDRYAMEQESILVNVAEKMRHFQLSQSLVVPDQVTRLAR